jgi:hypothetical protein
MMSAMRNVSRSSATGVLLALSLSLIFVGCSNNPTPAAPTAGQPAATVAADPLPSWNDGPAKQAILDFVKAKGWTVISMKNDWKQIFAWEK